LLVTHHAAIKEIFGKEKTRVIIIQTGKTSFGNLNLVQRAQIYPWLFWYLARITRAGHYGELNRKKASLKVYRLSQSLASHSSQAKQELGCPPSHTCNAAVIVVINDPKGVGPAGPNLSTHKVALFLIIKDSFVNCDDGLRGNGME
jgi:hypothetical protein